MRYLGLSISPFKKDLGLFRLGARARALCPGTKKDVV